MDQSKVLPAEGRAEYQALPSLSLWAARPLPKLGAVAACQRDQGLAREAAVLLYLRLRGERVRKGGGGECE